MADDEARLLNVFKWFSSFGGGVGADDSFMDGPRFQKFAQDTGLIDSKFPAPDVDLVFANIKVKAKTERRITFEGFKVAVELIAKKKYANDPLALEKVYKKIFASAGPTTTGTTKVENDSILQKMTDTNLYTGAHKSRFNADGSGTGMQETFGDRSPRGGSTSPRPPTTSGPRPTIVPYSTEPDTSKPKSASGSRPKQSVTRQESVADDSNLSDEQRLANAFKAFCSFGGGANADGNMMDGPRFNKFAKDTKIVDAKFPANSVDLVFADVKVKPKNERRINFSQFKVACDLLADKKYPNDPERLQKLYAKIFAAQGPVAVGTKAENDAILQKMTDTSQYTGAHKSRFDDDGKGRGLSGRDSIAKAGADPKDLAGKVARK